MSTEQDHLREFDEKEFARQWVIRGVGMPIPDGAKQGARCYHEWFVEPARLELERPEVTALVEALAYARTRLEQEAYDGGLGEQPCRDLAQELTTALAEYRSAVKGDK